MSRGLATLKFCKLCLEKFFSGKNHLKNFFFVLIDISLSYCETILMKEEPHITKTAFSFYLPVGLMEALRKAAMEQRRSVNFVVTEILLTWLARQGDSDESPRNSGCGSLFVGNRVPAGSRSETPGDRLTGIGTFSSASSNPGGPGDC